MCEAARGVLTLLNEIAVEGWMWGLVCCVCVWPWGFYMWFSGVNDHQCVFPIFFGVGRTVILGVGIVFFLTVLGEAIRFSEFDSPLGSAADATAAAVTSFFLLFKTTGT